MAWLRVEAERRSESVCAGGVGAADDALVAVAGTSRTPPAARRAQFGARQSATTRRRPRSSRATRPPTPLPSAGARRAMRSTPRPCPDVTQSIGLAAFARGSLAWQRASSESRSGVVDPFPVVCAAVWARAARGAGHDTRASRPLPPSTHAAPSATPAPAPRRRRMRRCGTWTWRSRRVAPVACRRRGRAERVRAVNSPPPTSATPAATESARDASDGRARGGGGGSESANAGATRDARHVRCRHRVFHALRRGGRLIALRSALQNSATPTRTTRRPRRRGRARRGSSIAPLPSSRATCAIARASRPSARTSPSISSR